MGNGENVIHSVSVPDYEATSSIYSTEVKRLSWTAIAIYLQALHKTNRGKKMMKNKKKEKDEEKKEGRRLRKKDDIYKQHSWIDIRYISSHAIFIKRLIVPLKEGNYTREGKEMRI